MYIVYFDNGAILTIDNFLVLNNDYIFQNKNEDFSDEISKLSNIFYESKLSKIVTVHGYVVWQSEGDVVK